VRKDKKRKKRRRRRRWGVGKRIKQKKIYKERKLWGDKSVIENLC
jgi:hypothetical protein